MPSVNDRDNRSRMRSWPDFFKHSGSDVGKSMDTGECGYGWRNRASTAIPRLCCV